MDLVEAKAWLENERCSVNMIPSEPFETFELRVSSADANYMTQAYLVLKAHKEGLICSK